MNSLMGASQNGCLEIVELLLQQKDTKINEVNLYGKSAIMLANSNQKKFKNIVELLKKQKDIIYNEKLLATETRPLPPGFGTMNPKMKIPQPNPSNFLEQVSLFGNL